MTSKNNTNVNPQQLAQAMQLMKEIYRESKAFERKHYTSDNALCVQEDIAKEYLENELKKHPSAIRKLAIYDLQRYFAQPLASYKSGFLEHVPTQSDIDAYYRGNLNGRITDENGKELYEKAPDKRFYGHADDHVVKATAMVDGEEVTITRRMKQPGSMRDPVRTVYEISSPLIQNRQVWVNERKDFDANVKNHSSRSEYAGDALKMGSDARFHEWNEADDKTGPVAHNPALVTAMGGTIEQALFGEYFTHDQARKLVTMANQSVDLAKKQQLGDPAKTSALVQDADAMAAQLGRHPKQNCVQKAIQQLDTASLVDSPYGGKWHAPDGNDGEIQISQIASRLNAMVPPGSAKKIMTMKGSVEPYSITKQPGCLRETAYVLGQVVNDALDDAKRQARNEEKTVEPVTHIPVLDASYTGYYLHDFDEVQAPLKAIAKPAPTNGKPIKQK